MKMSKNNLPLNWNFDLLEAFFLCLSLGIKNSTLKCLIRIFIHFTRSFKGFMGSSSWHSLVDCRTLHLYIWSKIWSYAFTSYWRMDTTNTICSEKGLGNLWGKHSVINFFLILIKFTHVIINKNLCFLVPNFHNTAGWTLCLFNCCWWVIFGFCYNNYCFREGCSTNQPNYICI